MHVLSYFGALATMFVNVYLTTGGKLGYLTDDQVRSRLCLTTGHIRANFLGFDPNKLRTHSICSGSMMGMYLVGTPVFTIMPIGHWSSGWSHFICVAPYGLLCVDGEQIERNAVHLSFSCEREEQHVKQTTNSTPSSWISPIIYAAVKAARQLLMVLLGTRPVKWR
jgi:hypothetical protein